MTRAGIFSRYAVHYKQRLLARHMLMCLLRLQCWSNSESGNKHADTIDTMIHSTPSRSCDVHVPNVPASRRVSLRRYWTPGSERA